jgi:secreted PhoX family phosphatase
VPADTLSTALEASTGLALDGHGNMWESGNMEDSLAMYSIAARNAGGAAAPTVVIQSSAVYQAQNLSFDSQGNLWLGICGNHTGTGRVVAPGILAFSPAQLAAGGVLSPAISITASSVLKCPHGVVFDGSGNGWVADDSTPQIVEFSAAQLASSGDKTPMATITGGGLVAASALAFDASGNLWVANDGGASVIEYTPAQLVAAGTQTPTVSITLLNGGDPRGLAFDNRGTLWVSDWKADIMWGLSKAQLAVSGSPAPSVRILVGWPTGQKLIPQQPAFDPFSTAPAP